MKLRRLRDGDVLEDGDVVLVRGGDLDPDILSEDAVRYHSIYGVYGISVFAVRDATIDEFAQQAPLGPLRSAEPADGQGCSFRGHEAGADRPQPASFHRGL
jgi:hypothetical protein